MGLSLSDFCALSPQEFDGVYSAWEEHELFTHREQWHRARFIALYCVAPHAQKGLTEKDIAVFPWETEKKKTQKQLKREMAQSKKRFQELAEKWQK